MATANSAAFVAPALPIASVPTGIPAGICTVESSESIPFRAWLSIGTPSTGRIVCAAITPAKCAAAPAAAIITCIPRLDALVAHSTAACGVRCADSTRLSCAIPNFVNMSLAWRIVSQSDLLPITIPTKGEEEVGALIRNPIVKGSDAFVQIANGLGGRDCIATLKVLTPMLKSLFGSKPADAPASTGGSLLDRLKAGIQKTRSGLMEKLDEAVSGRKEIDADVLDELEFALITADIGARTTAEILERLRQRVERHQLADSAQLKTAIKEHLLEILEANDRPMPVVAEPPAVILVVGVNGAGKTTSIGKLTRRLQSEGKSVLLCAADTFRAAAIEQLEVWAQRTGADLIKQQTGADPSAVAFDAVQAAKARKVDYLIVDTAGRLHTKVNLMAELEKMRRTVSRVIPDAPHEVLLVMEATTGQNGLEQARKFTETSAVSGIILTKLDGTAKGGVVVAISRELNLPIRYIGVGEQIDDLLPFDAAAFVNSLFD